MHPFQYHRAASLDDALRMAQAHSSAAFIAGGSDLLQLWKAEIARPALVIDITGLPLHDIAQRGEDLALGALVRMSDAAVHPLLLEHCPAVVQALLASASPQVRNLATLGGSLLQRTRCSYFRHGELPCNKRQPGSGCGALHGEHRQHAIFGASEHCAATHASDLAVALLAADARVVVRAPDTTRCLPLAELWALPGRQPQHEHTLAHGELITEILLTDSPCTRHACYLKVRERAAFEFALVSVAAGLQIEAGLIRDARVVAGGVGTVPWRLSACEAVLIGQPASASTFERAAASAIEHAAPLELNSFKLPLLQRAVCRALQTVFEQSAIAQVLQ